MEHTSDSNEYDKAITSSFTRSIEDSTFDKRAYAHIADETGDEPRGESSLESTDDEALKPGFLLRDRFEIVALVHSGGMGHVYKAIDKRRHLGASDQTYVAIKMMRRSVAPQLDLRLALEREAAKTQRLSHPNIVNIFDFDEHNEQFYLVMEWLEGESANALLRRTSGQRLAPHFAWQVIEGVAGALQHAHANNVVHADINPSNIFITDTQEIKLLDFGVARNISDPVRPADDEIIWATRTYASPEVLSGATPTFEDDVFSLACVAYRLLSGTHPFAGKTSSEAEQAGLRVAPISGLSEAHWQLLSRALSYAKSERPGATDAFFANLPQESASDVADRASGRWPAYWLRALPVVVVALIGGLWWLSQFGLQNDVADIRETATAADLSIVDAVATNVPSELDNLLSNALRAVDEEQFVLPEDDNARDWYRRVLSLDSANSIAQSGLRSISDDYVQQATRALRDDEPMQASAAIAIAAETDPLNPAVVIVNELLLAQGDGQFANARLAAAEGDADQAAEWLSRAERYAHLDENAIDAIRQQIAQIAGSLQERQFLSNLSEAEAYITAGRLIAPPGDNAHALLIDLQNNHETDSRLLASMEHLAERLLTRALLATVAHRYTEATALLKTADTLGVLTVEVATTRTSLRRAMDESMDAIIASADNAPEAAQLSSPIASEAELLFVSGEPVVDIPAAYAVGESASLPVTSSNSSGSATAAIADSGTSETSGSSQARTISLSDLGIAKYVAPKFPRGAARRQQTGVVELKFDVNTDGSTGAIETLHAEPGEVFVGSAQKAVQQWLFAPRDEVFTTRVTLRFELQ